MDWINELISKSKIERFYYSDLNDLKCELFIKRDDLIHPEISGNKIRKLKFNLNQVNSLALAGVVTYGGAFSNHLLATAAACNLANIRCIGRVRGDELNFQSNEVLRRCYNLGMELEFLSRESFTKTKYQDGIVSIKNEKYLSIPEGGANNNGVEGCKEIITEVDDFFDFYCVAQGTSTTSLGMLSSIPLSSKLIVVPVLKGFDSYLEMSKINNSEEFIMLSKQLIVLSDYHFGGYAKTTSELIAFVENFNAQNTFEIEPIYTGKAMFALVEYLKTNSISNKKVLFVHTGGLSNWK